MNGEIKSILETNSKKEKKKEKHKQTTPRQQTTVRVKGKREETPNGVITATLSTFYKPQQICLFEQVSNLSLINPLYLLYAAS